MVQAKIQYKTYDGKLPAIFEVFKTCHHYFESYKHKDFVLKNYNNLYYFIDRKNLSIKEVY